jgi:hypothetical protein
MMDTIRKLTEAPVSIDADDAVKTLAAIVQERLDDRQRAIRQLDMEADGV